MVKGGKRYSSMSNDGKWFAHPASPGNEIQNRENATSTGRMLSQVAPSLPQAYTFDRFTKCRPKEQEARDYPFTDHDNKRVFKDSIFVFTHGVGRKKCGEGLRQHDSQFCLCHDGPHKEEKRVNFTAYKSDFMVPPSVNIPTRARRFPRNHKKKSLDEALAQGAGQFMWFGQHTAPPPVVRRLPPATHVKLFSECDIPDDTVQRPLNKTMAACQSIFSFKNKK